MVPSTTPNTFAPYVWVPTADDTNQPGQPCYTACLSPWESLTDPLAPNWPAADSALNVAAHETLES
jgi:hypothetical protein